MTIRPSQAQEPPKKGPLSEHWCPAVELKHDHAQECCGLVLQQTRAWSRESVTWS